MPHQIVSRDEWLAARNVLLAKEKDFTGRTSERCGNDCHCPSQKRTAPA